ncbi:MAG: hypothetical protein AB7O62_17165 [Pirellulales bacterium]
MAINPWQTDEGPIELSPERLAAMSSEGLINLIHLLESRETGPAAIECDHRRYLERHELIRLVRLAASLQRKAPARRTTAGSL